MMLSEAISTYFLSFSVSWFDSKGNFYISVPGKHEVLDAVAALALSVCLLRQFGKNPQDYLEQISKGLLNFKGGE